MVDKYQLNTITIVYISSINSISTLTIINSDNKNNIISS